MLHTFAKKLNMKYGLLIICLLRYGILLSQSTEIFMFDIKKNENGGIEVSNRINISNKKGYDNQPFVSEDSKTVLFTSKRDSISTEIYQYDIKSKKTKRLTNNKENEYSPKIIYPEERCMVVKGPEQRISLYSKDFASEDTFYVSKDSVGYYYYLGNGKIAANILTKQHSLQLLDTANPKEPLSIAVNVGRTILPYKNGILFVQKGATKNDKNTICLYEFNTKKIITIIDLQPEKEDFNIYERFLYTIFDGKLYECILDEERNWKEVADLTQFNLKGITRLAIDNQFSKLVVVALEEDWMLETKPIESQVPPQVPNTKKNPKKANNPKAPQKSVPKKKTK